MYSQQIIQGNIDRIEAARRREKGNEKFRLVRFPRDVIEEMLEHLKSITKPDGTGFVRELTRDEQRFIENELIMTQIDFRYACENYYYIQPAPIESGPEGWSDLEENRTKGSASLARFQLNGMQDVLMAQLAEMEELCYEQARLGRPVNGILLILHKARQLGASTLFQALGYHRIGHWHGQNGLTAGIDQTGTEAMHRRFERIYLNLPFWMRPSPKFWTKDQGVNFHSGSVMELQNGSQKKDLGKGETWHFFHVTECAVFDRPEDNFDEGLFPAVPFGFQGGIPVLGGMESTAKGKIGWWYDFVTQVMSGTAEAGMGRFRSFFAPFYLIDVTEAKSGQRSKYRMDPPPDWVPAPPTVLMAEKVWETSPQFTLTKERVRLSREVLYWYERTRLQYYKKGKLNIFLQNYPVTPEESFQHSAGGAFSNETIERMDLNCSKYDPQPYRLLGKDEANLPDVQRLHDWPVFSVGGHQLGPMDRAELDKDARGVIFLWEQPNAGARYVLGADPTGGIPGWRREFRQQDDVKTDNAAIEVFRKGGAATRCEDCSGLGWKPTTSAGVTVECFACDGRGLIGGRAVQVCEFAAPVDPEELARYIYVLGRLFVGASDMDECLAIVESNNTGILTIKTLINTYHYSNLYQQRAETSTNTPRYMSGYGFNSGPTTVPVLHARSKNVLVKRYVDIRSRQLVKEYSDAVVKITGGGDDGGSIIVRERFYVPPGAGRHDDRMTASFLAFWALFDFSESGDMESAADSMLRELPPARNLAASDATAEEQRAIGNQVVEVMLGQYDLYFGHNADCDVTCTATHGADEDDYDSEDEEFSAYSY
jgi:hypothetical protein